MKILVGGSQRVKFLVFFEVQFLIKIFLIKKPCGLKYKLHKLYIHNLVLVPVDLSKLSYVLKNDIVKKICMMNWLKKLMPLILVELLKNRL